MKKIIMLLLLITNIILGQFFNGSLILEGSGLFTRIHYYNWVNGVDEGKDTYPIKGGYGFYLSGQFRLASNYSAEIRPGIFYSSRFFRSYQLGFNLRRALGLEHYAALGYNIQLNLFERGGHLFQPEVATSTINLTYGREVLSDLWMHISICKTTDDLFGHFTYEKHNYSNYLSWIIKLGVEWNFL